MGRAARSTVLSTPASSRRPECPHRRRACPCRSPSPPCWARRPWTDPAHPRRRGRPPDLLGARQRAARPDAVPGGRRAAADHRAWRCCTPTEHRRLRAPAGRRRAWSASASAPASAIPPCPRDLVDAADALRPRGRRGPRQTPFIALSRAVVRRARRGGVRRGRAHVRGPAGAHPRGARARRPGDRRGPAGPPPRRLGPAGRRRRHAAGGRAAGGTAAGPPTWRRPSTGCAARRPPAGAALTGPEETVLLQSLGTGSAHPGLPRGRAGPGRSRPPTGTSSTPPPSC